MSEETPFEERKKLPKRLSKNDQIGKSSSFYERDNAPLENIIRAELEHGLAHAHTVSFTEYYISGKDHLNQKTINQYSMVKKLGQGEFGTVFLAHVNETHEDFAMKVFSKGKLAGRKDMVKDEATGRMVRKNWLEEV